MEVNTAWAIFIVVGIFAIIISNIALLKISNKPFKLPDGYEKKKDEDRDKVDDKPSSLL